MTAPIVGTEFHVLGTISIPAGDAHAVAARRGDSFVITAQMIDDTTDRNGQTWLADIDDEAAQTARWGERLVAPGPTPSSVTWWNHPADTGSRLWARAQDREVAQKITDPAERAQKLREIDALYGKPLTSQTIAYLA